VIAESFTAEAGGVASQPAVDQEASQATVTIPMTYTLLGIKNDDLSAVLTVDAEKKIDSKESQRVYDNGYSAVKVTIIDKPSPTKLQLQLETSSRIGPNINTEQLARQVAGKRYGEIEAMVTKLPGVKSVETDFSPFWVTKAPKAEKITIKLEVADGS
jgi:hypothetical protein